MKQVSRLAGISTLALLLGGAAAHAQGMISGADSVDDRIEDIETDVNRDLDRANDAARFGNPEYKPGLSGSASLGYSGKTGNNENQELTLGARLRYASGPMVQTLSMALDFTEEDNESTQKDVFGVYDFNYYFSDRFYGFVLGRVVTDGLADELTADDIADGTTLADKVEQDAFLGIGPGWRVLNEPDMTWRVQAGVGVSYLKYGDGSSDTEAGVVASSRFFKSFSDNVFLTMDTDVLNSSSALRVNNDLGVNFRMSEGFATRVSYLTDYNESRAIRTDNKLGVSLVYGF